MTTIAELRPEVAAVLRRAADHIERTGLFQGTWFEPQRNDKKPLGDRPCCVLGAVGFEAGYWQPIGEEGGFDNRSIFVPGTYQVDPETARAHDLNEVARWALGRSLAINHPDEAYLQTGSAGADFIHPPEWNDEEGRTQEQVVAALRTTAEEFERGVLGPYPGTLTSENL